MVVEDSSTGGGIVTTAWAGGAGQITGKITDGSGDSATTEAVTTGTLSQDGTFTLDLPGSVDGAKLHAFTGSFFDVGAQTQADSGTTACSGSPTLSSASARGVMLLVNVEAARNGSIVPLLAASSGTSSQSAGGFQIGGLLYVDSPVIVGGKVVCTSTYSGTQVTGTVTYRLNLAAGWNKLTIRESSGATSLSGGANSQDISLTSGAFPTDQWLFSPYTAPIPVRPEQIGSPVR